MKILSRPSIEPKTINTLTNAALLAISSIFIAPGALASSSTCPANATDIAPSFSISLWTTNGAGVVNTPVSGQSISSHQALWVSAGLRYQPNGASGPACSFSGGQITVSTASSASNPVNCTPSGGVPMIAPASETLPGGCADGGNSAITTQPVYYGVPTPADIAAGRMVFLGRYSQATALMAPVPAGALNALASTFLNIGTPPNTLQTCPNGATAYAPQVGIAAFRANPDNTVGGPVGLSPASSCLGIWLRVSLAYTPWDAFGNPTCSFSDGHITVHSQGGDYFQDFTPEQHMPLIGPLGSCAPTNYWASQYFFYMPTAADIAAGGVYFEVNYTNGTAWIAPGASNVVCGSGSTFVSIAAPVTASVSPTMAFVCAGDSTTFAATPSSGIGPYTYTWRGPNGFSSTNSSVTVTNRSAADLGGYTVTILDQVGCTSTKTATLGSCLAPAMLVNPQSLPDGRMTFTLQGPNRPYSIVGSSSLSAPVQNWPEVIRVTNTAPQTVIVCPRPPSGSFFYRAKGL